MKLLALLLIILAGFCCIAQAQIQPVEAVKAAQRQERIIVAPDKHRFITSDSKRSFTPWGMNYGNPKGLMEDFWNEDWETFAGDFREMKTLKANVVRVHLQFGKFMNGPDHPNTAELRQLARMLRLAEELELYLDITGLACYRPADVPAWYDALDEQARWAAQSKFWEAVAEVCAPSPAVFCYDLMNEPISPGDKRAAGKWYSGTLFGGFDFIQVITLDPAGRKREDVAVTWIRQMSAAIRRHDKATLITVGQLPWVRDWKHLSGFIPEKVAPELDFLSVHLYPDTKKPGEAQESLGKFTVGKPVVIEETFPLSCSSEELTTFLRASREIACGWIGHYNGETPEELDALEKSGKRTPSQAIYREWLRLFTTLKPEFAPE
ncbi:cellulase family glycosylhydrolase [Verrucomicrobiota bacterium sgz303538]